MKVMVGSLARGMVIVVTVIVTSKGYADKTVDENGFVRLKAGQEVRRYGRTTPTPTGNSW